MKKYFGLIILGLLSLNLAACFSDRTGEGYTTSIVGQPNIHDIPTDLISGRYLFNTETASNFRPEIGNFSIGRTFSSFGLGWRVSSEISIMNKVNTLELLREGTYSSHVKLLTTGNRLLLEVGRK